jgi:glycosyltransferase involved in cell wall biosynthesis
MYLNKKVAVVLPAYNAAKTLEATFREIPFDIVDEVILCDGASTDQTVEVAEKLGIQTIVKHDRNKGYGANQKSLYNVALSHKADIIVMLHPDYQYTPKLITAMVSLIGQQLFPVVLGSRILGAGALKGGMPVYKYIANRLLTFFQNVLCGQKLSEYHTGYRAYDQAVLKKIAFQTNSDDFVFDNEVLSQIIYAGITIGEISCPARYEEASSSINVARSVKYGLGVVRGSVLHWLKKSKLMNFEMYKGQP